MEQLGCPACGEQSFCTIETVQMLNPFVMYGEQPEWHSEPEMCWDTSTITGVICEECNWEASTENGRVTDVLVPVGQIISEEEEDTPDDDF